MSKDEYEKSLWESGYKNVSLIYTEKKEIKTETKSLPQNRLV